MRESMLKTETIDEALRDIYAQRDKLIAELEAQKIGATPSQIFELNRRIAELRGEIDKEIEKIRQKNSEEQILGQLSTPL